MLKKIYLSASGANGQILATRNQAYAVIRHRYHGTGPVPTYLIWASKIIFNMNISKSKIKNKFESKTRHKRTGRTYKPEQLFFPIATTKINN